MRKLLSKPVRAFTIYALVILLCSIPVYYMVVDFIWIHELDERNTIIREMVEEGARKVKVNEAGMDQLLLLWNTIQPGTRLVPSPGSSVKDSFYTAKRNTTEKGDRLRGLASTILINDKPYLLTVETNVEEADETIAALSAITIFFFILLAGGFIFLNKRISGNIWRPFSDTLEKLQAFDLAKDHQLNFSQTDIEEFQQLNDTLDKLINANIHAYNQQKVFIENASHELQTPLALLRSKMDILLQNKDITTEQLNILESIELPVSRMTRINKNLLLLAKIENSQFTEVERIDLSVVIQESCLLLADYIQDKDLQFDNKVIAPFFTEGNVFLVETLVNNLLINAIRHTPKNGIMSIELDGAALLVKNSGDTALRKEALFERFGNVSATSVSGGLGLAIIKEICNRYQWKISYSFDNNFHCFAVSFS